MCKHNATKSQTKVTKYPSVANLVKRTLCATATSALWNECLVRVASLYVPTDQVLRHKDFIKFYILYTSCKMLRTCI